MRMPQKTFFFNTEEVEKNWESEMVHLGMTFSFSIEYATRL